MPVILFPISLYDTKLIPKEWEAHTFYLLEEPIFWGTDPKRRLNMNQLKLVLHRASMKYYEKLLKSKGYKVKYIEEKELSKKGYSFLKNESDLMVYIFDPTDHLLTEKVSKEASKYNKDVTVYETPNFLLTEEQLWEYVAAKQNAKPGKDGRTRYFHQHFYTWAKKTLDLDDVIGSKTYDAENRKALPQNVKIPPIEIEEDSDGWAKEDEKLVKEAESYVTKNYGDNYGNGKIFYLPVTHKTAEKWFHDFFLKKRFYNFGDYQDAMTTRSPVIFHSLITPMLNVGLLDPQWVVDETIKYFDKHGGKGGLEKNDFEGYLRQIIGWREYSRMLYVFVYDEIKNGNYFNHKAKLTKAWYHRGTGDTGGVGVYPVDWSINTAFEIGYLHHILRLMMMANFMNLCTIEPHEVYKWFMEFSLDSYDWVMTNNVYSMGLYADGGLTMRKPYISSSNYIKKMSDFKGGEWEQIWDDLFYRFIVKNEKKLVGTPYVRNLYHFKKKSKAEQAAIIRRANKYIKSVTK